MTDLRNSLCKSIGHEWKSGLDPDFRTCTRSQCRAAERLVEGIWIDATRHSSTRLSQATTSPSSSSSLLWNTALYDELHVNFLYHGYDARRERELERRYYKSVTDEQVYRAALSRRQREGGH